MRKNGNKKNRRQPKSRSQSQRIARDTSTPDRERKTIIITTYQKCHDNSLCRSGSSSRRCKNKTLRLLRRKTIENDNGDHTGKSENISLWISNKEFRTHDKYYNKQLLFLLDARMTIVTVCVLLIR